MGRSECQRSNGRWMRVEMWYLSPPMRPLDARGGLGEAPALAGFECLCCTLVARRFRRLRTFTSPPPPATCVTVPLLSQSLAAAIRHTTSKDYSYLQDGAVVATGGHARERPKLAGAWRDHRERQDRQDRQERPRTGDSHPWKRYVLRPNRMAAPPK